MRVTSQALCRAAIEKVVGARCEYTQDLRDMAHRLKTAVPVSVSKRDKLQHFWRDQGGGHLVIEALYPKKPVHRENRRARLALGVG